MCAATRQNLVGQSMPTLEAPMKAVGAIEYMGDIDLPDMAHAKVLRSPFAHARILSIDASAARALPGVVSVFTRDEVENDPNILPLYGFVYRDAPVIGWDKVRHQGDIVAVVVAETVDLADEAKELIEVEYEELPSAMTVQEALKPDAPRVHDEFFPIAPELRPIEGTNICHHATLSHGDIEQGFRDSDFIYEDEFSAPPVQHCALDLHAVIAQVRDGEITVWTNCQSPFPLQREIQRILGMPARVIVPYVGGGFGSKSRDRIEIVIAAAAKFAGGRPVRLVFTQEETFQTYIRPAYSCKLRTGVKKDGTIVARHIRFYTDVGGYAISGARSANNTLKVATGPYKIPNALVEAFAVYTNKPPSAPYRGLPTTQHTMSYEAQLDRIAKDLGIDPVAIRMKNLVEDGDIHVTGDYLRSAHGKECLEQVAKAIEWGQPSEDSGSSTKLRGKGVSSTIKYTLTPPTRMSENGAEIMLGEDGVFEVRIGTVNIGQGSDTTMLQIAGDALGVGMESLRVVHSDTALTPVDSSTTASRSTYHMGNAVVSAAEDLKPKIIERASHMLEKATEILILGPVGVYARDDQSTIISYGDLADLGGPLSGEGECVVGGLYTAPDGKEYPTASTFWTFASAGIEVEVDTRTGKVTILKMAGSATVGTAVNPQSIDTQLEGGLGMELGPTLFEQLTWDENGQLLNSALFDYPLPTSQTAPQYLPSYVDHPFEGGPFGAKGMGEIGSVVVPGAVLNAMHDATGVMFHSVPLLPHVVLQTLDEHLGGE